MLVFLMCDILYCIYLGHTFSSCTVIALLGLVSLHALGHSFLCTALGVKFQYNLFCELFFCALYKFFTVC